MFMDTDGIPDDMDGANVILALALGNADNVELWNPDRFVPLERVKGGGVKGIELLAEIVGMPEGGDVAVTEVMPTAVLFKEFVGSLEEGDTLDEVMLDEVVPDGAELVGNPLDELLREIAGKPEEAEEL